MATKRLFSKDVVRTDRFLDMPQSAQALYFHLCLDADAKGFVSPGLVMRMINAQPDDLKVLAAKEFVIPFESGVVVVTHWNVHNSIRLDREAPSQFVEELKTLVELTEGKYKLLEYSRQTPVKGLEDSGTTERNLTELNLTERNRKGSAEGKTSPHRKTGQTDFLMRSGESLRDYQTQFPTKNIREEYNKACDYLKATGKTYKDYDAFFRNWLRRADATVIPTTKG